MAFLSDDLTNEPVDKIEMEQALQRMQKAQQAAQEAKVEMNEAGPSMLKVTGIGALAVFLGIYWFLIR